MKLSEAIRSLREQTGNRTMDPDTLIGYVDEAVSDLATILRLTTDGTIALVVDQADYPLPTDCLNLRKAEIEGAEIVPTSLPFSSSYRYRLIGDSIRFVPTPADGGTVTIEYWRRPVSPRTQAMDADIDVPAEALPAVMAYCRAMVGGGNLAQYVSMKTELMMAAAKRDSVAARREFGVERSWDS